MELNEKQSSVVDAYLDGKSMFVTGPGGTGKTFLIHHLCNMNKEIQKTALTGTAASLIGNGATTIHSWAGIGLGTKDVDQLIKSIKYNKRLLIRWKNCRTLIIDEISMMTAELFDKLNQIAMTIKNNSSPFGGIQLLLFGDMYQLPPVETLKGYIFESPAFRECIQKVIHLDEIVRQKDPVWQNILNNIRIGKIDKDMVKVLESKRIQSIDDVKDLEIKPTILYCKRIDVDEMNLKKLEELKDPQNIYKVSTRLLRKANTPMSVNLDEKELKATELIIDKQSPYKEELKLKIGSQVMLIKNMDVKEGLVNGSRGVVIEFTDNKMPIVKFKNGTMIMEQQSWEYELEQFIVSRYQIPLVLAWASTIHKCQGQTLDVVAVDIGSDVFEAGQIYTALSRVRELDGLYLLDFDPKRIRISKKVKEFYESVL
jgi:ATP-dependent DNA helicase PIF1